MGLYLPGGNSWGSFVGHSPRRAPAVSGVNTATEGNPLPASRKVRAPTVPVAGGGGGPLHAQAHLLGHTEAWPYTLPGRSDTKHDSCSIP